MQSCCSSSNAECIHKKCAVPLVRLVARLRQCRYSQLTTLCLRGTGLNDASVLELCDGLHAARQLQRLDLSHNYITGTGLDVLVDAMTQVGESVCG